MTLPLVASVVGGLLARRRLLRRRDPARFLATVSHELRTPLNAILGWVNLLKSGTLASGDTARALDCIERNIHLETRLVDQLIEASRLLGGRMPLVMGPARFDAVVDAAVAEALPVAREKGVEIVRSDPSASAPSIVSGDDRRLFEAACHLLLNAVKFTPAGGQVQVAVERSGNRVELRVADTGEGIAAEDLPHVFEPFQQGQTVAKRAGLGLGLAVVRHLVHQHGGSISAHSAGRGKGAVFRVSLPLLSSQSGSPETTRR